MEGLSNPEISESSTVLTFGVEDSGIGMSNEEQMNDYLTKPGTKPGFFFWGPYRLFKLEIKF